MALTKELIFAMYNNHEDMFLDFISSILDLDIDCKNSNIKKLNKYFSENCYIYPFIVNDKYFIGLALNSDKNTEVNKNVYEHFNNMINSNKENINVLEKYYLQLNINDKDESSSFKETKKDNDINIYIYNLNKFRQLYDNKII